MSVDNKAHVLRILSYPITPVPLPLCHLDGGIYKTDKLVFTKCLETNIDHDPPGNAGVFLTDSHLFTLHSMKKSAHGILLIILKGYYKWLLNTQFKESMLSLTNIHILPSKTTSGIFDMKQYIVITRFLNLIKLDRLIS